MWRVQWLSWRASTALVFPHATPSFLNPCHLNLTHLHLLSLTYAESQC